MTRVAVHACDLQRLEGLLFARDPVRARIGPPEQFYDRVYTERALATMEDQDAAAEALQTLIFGPAPDKPLGRIHATVFRSIVETLCPRIDDDVFGGSSLATIRRIADHLNPQLGPGLSESVTGRRIAFVRLEEDPALAAYSYWTRDEMKQFLRKYDEAGTNPGPVPPEHLRQLRDVWRGALAQGPDALLVITR